MICIAWRLSVYKTTNNLQLKMTILTEFFYLYLYMYKKTFCQKKYPVILAYLILK